METKQLKHDYTRMYTLYLLICGFLLVMNFMMHLPRPCIKFIMRINS